MKKPSLSIIIPTYNEEASLRYVLEDTLKDLPRYVKDYEIIVVDDGSTDNTPQLADAFTKRNRRVQVIHQRHGGLNKALIAGLVAAKKNYIAYMPGDGQDLVRDMVNCFRIMDKYDLILGIRGKRIDYSLYRLLLSYGAQFLYRILFDLRYEDVHWAYVWKTKEVQKLKLDPKGGMFLFVESLVKFRRKGLKIGEASAPYRPRFAGEGKNTSPQVVWRTFVSSLKLWKKIRTGKV